MKHTPGQNGQKKNENLMVRGKMGCSVEISKKPRGGKKVGVSRLTCASRRENEKTPKDQTIETYLCLTSGRENVIEKRQMAQESHIAIHQKQDRCP
jgi:hypothetical protein